MYSACGKYRLQSFHRRASSHPVEYSASVVVQLNDLVFLDGGAVRLRPRLHGVVHLLSGRRSETPRTKKGIQVSMETYHLMMESANGVTIDSKVDSYLIRVYS